MRHTEIVPKDIVDELIRLAKLDPDWVEFVELGYPKYSAKLKQEVRTDLWKFVHTGADAFGLLAVSQWLVDGPKLFRPTPEQCAALEQVEVRIPLEDYAQPYPTLLIELPKGKYMPFTSVLCFLHSRPYFIGSLRSEDNKDDVITTVTRGHGVFMEESLQSFDDDCKNLSSSAGRALRVACNSCLALVHHGHHLSYLFPKEVERDQRLAKEDTERGERARGRLDLAVQVASFDQSVTLHRVQRGSWDGEPGCSGRSVSPHWRRGHWRMQAFGVDRSQRRRILIPPVLVRSDLFGGGTENTSVVYK